MISIPQGTDVFQIISPQHTAVQLLFCIYLKYPLLNNCVHLLKKIT